jgi:hypothetical protein
MSSSVNDFAASVGGGSSPVIPVEVTVGAAAAGAAACEAVSVHKHKTAPAKRLAKEDCVRIETGVELPNASDVIAF